MSSSSPLSLGSIPVPQGGVISSPNDSRQYKLVTLPNQLEVLLISDPTCEKAAASWGVGVGSMSNPKEIAGLAHFLEHMLFMGTKTFPQENAYQLYLSNHGGSSNAYTAQDHTIYYFDVACDSLRGALEIFASFFICPLFNEDALDREIQAVDSENEKNLQNDTWRTFQLAKVVADPSHPYHNFATGNSKTLKVDVEAKGIKIRDAVMDFYLAHYSSNNSKLCVYGKESIEELSAWTTDLFAAVENRNVPLPIPIPGFPYPKENCCGKMVTYKPVVDKKALTITFPCPGVSEHYKNPPFGILSHLIGHESKGSLLQALKDRNFANSLASYTSESYPEFSIFAMNIELTDLGTENVSEIIAMAFSYISILTGESSVPLSVPAELMSLGYVDFLYTEKYDTASYVTNVVSSMLKYKGDPLLLFLPAHLEQNTNLASRLAREYFTPDNAIIYYKNQVLFDKVDTSSFSVEEYYKILYYEKKFSETDMQLWADCVTGKNTSFRTDLHLPAPNPYIPSDFTLYCSSEEATSSSLTSTTSVDTQTTYPFLLERCVNGVRLDKGNGSREGHFKVPTSRSFNTWFKMDTFWKVPKVLLNCTVISPECALSPLNSILAELLCSFIDEKLNLDTYYAPIAGLNYALQAASHINTQQTRVFSGIIVDVYGYNHKAVALMEKILSEFRMFANEYGCPHLNADKLASDKAIYTRLLKKIIVKYNSTLFNTAIQINRRHIGLILHEGSHSILDVLDVVGYKSNLAYASSKSSSSSDDTAAPRGLAFEDLQMFAAKLFKLGVVSTPSKDPSPPFTGADAGTPAPPPYVCTSGNFRLEVFVYGNTCAQQAKEVTARIQTILCNDDSSFVVEGHRSEHRVSAGGDVDSSAEEHLATKTKKVISLSSALERPRRGVVFDLSQLSARNATVVTRSHSKYYNPEEKNSVCQNMYLFGRGVEYRTASNAENLKCEAVCELISQLASEQFFDILRSKEQLGYVCWLMVAKSFGRVGIDTIIQSSHASPNAINKRVEAFFKTFFDETLSVMPAETFDLFKKATIDNLLERPKNLIEEGYAFHGELANQQLLFNRKVLIADVVKEITHGEVVAMFTEKILNVDRRTKVSAFFYGKDKEFEDLTGDEASPASGGGGADSSSSSEVVEVVEVGDVEVKEVKVVEGPRELFYEVTDSTLFRSMMSLAPMSFNESSIKAESEY